MTMDVFRLAERSMTMSEEIWQRHANPWSVWSRFSCFSTSAVPEPGSGLLFFLPSQDIENLFKAKMLADPGSGTEAAEYVHDPSR